MKNITQKEIDRIIELSVDYFLYSSTTKHVETDSLTGFLGYLQIINKDKVIYD